MRDPKRIEGFCDKLKKILGALPDWRFGQLMSNLLGEYYAETKQDIFFVEDDELFAFFRKKMGFEKEVDA